MTLIRCLIFCLSGMSGLCWAGRPIATDDASTADKGTCQLEGWQERAKDSRTLVVAPACGVADALELGINLARPSPRDPVKQAAGITMKWVPTSLAMTSAIGELQLGLELSSVYERAAAWKQTNAIALGLATLKINPLITLHANLGHSRDQYAKQAATLLNLAIVTAPTEDFILFAETQTNDRRRVFGGAINTIGGRWWLIKDRLGLDLTASRIVGSSNGTTWTAGFGWYGIAF
jgi:hypothetical protein